VGGLGGGLTVGLVGGLSAKEPAYAELRLRGRIGLLARKLTAWSSIRAEFVGGLTAGLADGPIAGLAFGLMFGLAKWAKTPLTNGRPQTPTVTFHRDLQLAYFYSLVIGLWVGFGFGAGPEGGLVNGLAVGLVAAIAVGLAVGLGQSSGQHLVTVAVLRAQRRVPLRLLTFLDDAHRLGILREAGSVYKFRHAKLQDRLAQTYTTRA
jgi:hypothetical protein